MRISEVLTELRKKKEPKAGDTTPHDYNPGWENLNWMKERAQRNGQRYAGSYQLFMPRANAAALTPRDKRLQNLSNRYAYDDQGNIKQGYADWEEPRKEPHGAEVAEAAPILNPGKAMPPPGRNKPVANLWTSTAKQTPNGWTSDWVRWVSSNQPGWMAPTGYLYRVKPGALVLELNSDRDAEDLYYAFIGLGTATPIDYNTPYGRLTTNFPWDQVAKHFDAVNHSGYHWDGEFMYGWDCESTAWLDTSFLQLVGEVPIATNTEDDQ